MTEGFSLFFADNQRFSFKLRLWMHIKALVDWFNYIIPIKCNHFVTFSFVLAFSVVEVKTGYCQ